MFFKNVIKSIYKASSTHFLFFFTLIAGCVALLPTFLYVFFANLIQMGSEYQKWECAFNWQLHACYAM